MGQKFPTLPPTHHMAAKKHTRFLILAELWEFMKARKKWWLGPIVLLLLLLGFLVVMTQGSALAPFIYTLF